MGQLIILKDVPGGPVVKSTPAKEKKKKESAYSAGTWVQSLVRELRSHIPRSN